VLDLLFYVGEIFLTKRTMIVTLRRCCIEIFYLALLTLSGN